jgi:hypothetical protein
LVRRGIGLCRNRGGTEYLQVLTVSLAAPVIERDCRSTPPEEFVRLCYYVVVRTTLDISDEAYYIAKAIARDQNRSLGRVVGYLILQSSKGTKGASIKMSDYGFPTFRCTRPVTTEDVKALDDEE